MKKIGLFISVLALCFMPALGLVACGDDFGEIEFKTKYVRENKHMRSDDYHQTYYLFYEDGTGVYHRYDEITVSATSIIEYSISFKYTYLDSDKSAVRCYFDSVKLGDKNTWSVDADDLDDWASTLTVSKNVLMTSQGVSFINADYMKNVVPEYCK